VVAAVRDDKTPATDDRDRWRAAMSEMKDALTDDRDRVADEPDLLARDAMLELIDGQIEHLKQRIAVVEDDAWPPADDDLDLGGPEAPSDDVVAALEKAGLAGRDCETIGSSPGPIAAAPRFAAEAAETCRAIVDRRRLGDFEKVAETSLEIVLAVKEGEDVDVTDEQIAAVTAVKEEWQQTHDDVAAVSITDLSDTSAWQTNLDVAQNRLDVFTDRLSALEKGDAAEVEAAFDSSRIDPPGWDWQGVGLDGRDCRGVQG